MLGSRFTRFTREGFEVLQIYEVWGTYYAVAENNGEYVWGRNYNLKKGYWSGGDYRRTLEEISRLVIGRLVIDNIGRGDLRK